VPINVPELGGRARCRYAFLSFDSFNLRFESIRINLTTAQEYGQRRLSKAHLERSRDLTQFISKADAEQAVAADDPAAGKSE